MEYNPCQYSLLQFAAAKRLWRAGTFAAPKLEARCCGTQTAETAAALKPSRGRIAAAITEPGCERENGVDCVPVFFAIICRRKTPLAGQIGGPEPLPRQNAFGGVNWPAGAFAAPKLAARQLPRHQTLLGHYKLHSWFPSTARMPSS